MTCFFFKHQFILQNRYLFSPVSSGAGADGIAKRTETHWPRALPAKHQFVRQNWYGPDLGPRAVGGDGMRRTVTHCHARKKPRISGVFVRQ